MTRPGEDNAITAARIDGAISILIKAIRAWPDPENCPAWAIYDRLMAEREKLTSRRAILERAA